MAYGNKYLFRFDSVRGQEYSIYILKEGYSGTVYQRALGRAPVLKKKQNGPIRGTSLELYAECKTDGEFAELYTSDPKEYRVDVYRGSVLLWTGFVSTELYSEPAIAPPYDVQVVASDGLGELKLVDYEAQGEMELKDLFAYLLSFTGSDRGFYYATNLFKQGSARKWMLSWLIDVDFMAGKTCYDVLTLLLNSLHATITTYRGYWLIARETDIETLLSGKTLSVTSYVSGTVTATSIRNIVITGGQMGVADIWPVGHYSTVIQPARKSVTVAAPWHVNNILANPDLDSTLGGWTVSEYVSWGGNAMYLGPLGHYAEAYQSISLASLMSELVITAKAGGMTSPSPNKATIYFFAVYQTQDGYFYGDADGWMDSDPSRPRVPHELDGAGLSLTRKYHDLEERIPALNQAAPGTLTIYVAGQHVDLQNIHLTLALQTKGYKDTIHIDNGARGEDDEQEILHGRITETEFNYPPLLTGAFKDVVNGVRQFIYTFEDSHYSNADFLSITALNRALSVALPRLKQEGSFDTEGMTVFPVFLLIDSLVHVIETFDWDLFNDEIKISALSLPAAQITVESESVVPLDDSYSSSTISGGGSSSGGGGGSSSGTGTSLLNVWRSLANDTSLDSYDDNTAIALEHLTALFTVETLSGGGKYLKLNTQFLGLAADGFITAGGTNSGGGGGGGVDLDRVWESLTNNTDEPDVKINAAHIPVASTSAIGGVKVDGTSITINNGVISAVAQGTGTVNSLTVGNQNYTPDANGVITIPAYPTTLPASDVSAWAKASTKPSYSLSEIGEADDLQAIEALTGTGFLKRTGTNTWSIDNSTYLTAVPKATDSVIGGFQTGYSESGKNYAVKMSGNKAYVNVPWTDTVYTHPTDGANTTISAANGKVLSSITVDTMGHVTAVAAKTLAKVDIPTLDYLPLTGGELTGDLWLHTGSANYGSKLWFGDKGSGDGYAYIHEDTDDHLHIHADKGIKLSTGNNYGVQVDNNVTISSSRSLTLGDGVLTWDSTRSAWKLTGNFYATGFLTAGGVNVQNGVLNVENNVVIDSSKTVTFGSGAVLSYSSGWKLTASLNVTALTIGSGSSAMNVASVIADLQQRVSALENQ